MKLIFKTEKEGRDSIKTLIKMDKSHIFPNGRYYNKANK